MPRACFPAAAFELPPAIEVEVRRDLSIMPHCLGRAERWDSLLAHTGSERHESNIICTAFWLELAVRRRRFVSGVWEG